MSILSDSGLLLKEIYRLVGHSSMPSRKRGGLAEADPPVIQSGATAMDGIFGAGPKR
ncbi:hypothetical protein GCM10023084_54570 [Streptomyces lacrimifluminis]|uniref:Uncharacterized protein n=1 Tax=Streptomyces lacrimifluminis TaxID=1500077 RepID=A0A917KY74_9ACTN|nr:hypothetical protein GCM10012282_33290 [Streptomyces lacrimifluminis]